MCGMTRVFLWEVRKAIAALALGTETIPADGKKNILVPGNSYVTEKLNNKLSQLAGGPAIDLPAGPQGCSIAGRPRLSLHLSQQTCFSQAEHGPEKKKHQVIFAFP